jgi:hypothetical protein
MNAFTAPSLVGNRLGNRHSSTPLMVSTSLRRAPITPGAISDSDWPLAGSRRPDTQDPHTLGHAVGGAGDHHSAVAVTDEDHLPQILKPQQSGDITDVAVQVDIRPDEVESVREAGQTRGIYVMSLSPQHLGDRPVAAAAVTTAMYQHVRCQGVSPSVCGDDSVPQCHSPLCRNHFRELGRSDRSRRTRRGWHVVPRLLCRCESRPLGHTVSKVLSQPAIHGVESFAPRLPDTVVAERPDPGVAAGRLGEVDDVR